MGIKYVHTNIISNDWEKLMDFYIKVFNCKPVLPKRNQSWDLLERWTWIKNAHLKWMHLRLPWYDENWPTLEIYSYTEMVDKPNDSVANRKWFWHIAFEVDDVENIVKNIIVNWWQKLWEIVSKEVLWVWTITFTYMTDPEWNILEIQNWKYEK